MPGDLLSCLLAHLTSDREEKTCIILCGEVGAGKTHSAEYLAAILKKRGFAVGGVLSPRVVQDGETVGYMARDLATGEERPFARVVPPGLPVGRFFIVAEGLIFARSAVEQAIATAQVVFVDEVGRLELAGDGLASAVRALLNSQALPVLLVRSTFVDAVVCTFGIARFEALPIEQEEAPSSPERKAQRG